MKIQFWIHKITFVKFLSIIAHYLDNFLALSGYQELNAPQNTPL